MYTLTCTHLYPTCNLCRFTPPVRQPSEACTLYYSRYNQNPIQQHVMLVCEGGGGHREVFLNAHVEQDKMCEGEWVKFKGKNLTLDVLS